MKENARQSECGLRCKYCGYDTHEDIIKAAFWMNDGLIAIEGIPARLCKGCGEQFFDEQITERIQKLLKNPIAESERQIRVSVYDFPQLESTEKHRQSQSIRANKDSQAILRCKYCESETVEELVKSAFWVDEQLIAVENIPARVCQECKVQFYDDETAEGIATLERIRSVPDAARRDAMVTVFSLPDKDNTVDNGFHRDTSDRFCER
jgi:YgiT-type zinc finger domain-containing protein